MPEPLLHHLDRIAAKLRSAARVLIFSDFDGTLVPIRNRPEECSLDGSVGATLSALAVRESVHVGIVSGRGLADLRPRVGLAELAYAGNHGLEIEGPGFAFREPVAEAASRQLNDLAARITESLAAIPGAWVEHKGLSLSIHFRQVAVVDVPRVGEQVRAVVAEAISAGLFVLRTGKAVLEVRPAVNWHKGSAVRWLTQTLAAETDHPTVIYLGDDDTDEDAFAMLDRGFGISVGHRRHTAAHYSVPDPRGVHDFLNWMLDHLRR